MQIVALTQELLGRQSLTPLDAGCQAVAAALLERAGYDVERFHDAQIEALYARRGRSAPALVFAAHTDVAPAGLREQWRTDPFTAMLSGGELTARGAARMKGSVAAMLKACERFAAAYPQARGSLALLLTSDGENQTGDAVAKTMQTLARRGETPAYCVLGEPASAERCGDTVAIGRQGSLTASIKLRGVQGHVAYPLHAANPMHALARLAAALTGALDARSSRLPATSCEILSVHSDANAPNVVPGELHCVLRVNYSSEWTHAALAARIEALLVELALDHELHWHRGTEPFVTADGALTAAASRAVREITGDAPVLGVAVGPSSGAWIARHGVEVVELGPRAATAHEPNERIAIADLESLEQIYFRIAEILLGEAS